MKVFGCSWFFASMNGKYGLMSFVPMASCKLANSLFGPRLLQRLQPRQDVRERRVLVRRARVANSCTRSAAGRRIHFVKRPADDEDDEDEFPEIVVFSWRPQESGVAAGSRISVTEDLVTSILASAERSETVLSFTVMTTPTMPLDVTTLSPDLRLAAFAPAVCAAAAAGGTG